MKKTALVFAILLFLTGCTQKIENDETPIVSYIEAKNETMENKDTLYGFIDRGLDRELSFSLDGIIEKIYVKEGESVKKGARLAKLDNKEYSLNVDKSKYELNDAYVKYNRAKSYYERITKLYQAGGISYNDWENADTEVKSSLNRIKILKDDIALSEKQKSFTEVLAPFDGYIIKTFKEEGEYTKSGEAIFYFQGKGELEARIFATEKTINSIKIGQRVILSSGDKIFEGTVKSKVNSSFENGSYRVTVKIESDNPDLLDGMNVKAEIIKNEITGIFIPKEAVLADIDGNYVYILNDNKAEKRNITTGKEIDNKILITRGIEIGELVIVEGATKVMNGIKVKFE